MFSPITKQTAKTISAWTYSGEYACYSFAQDQAATDELLNGDYFAALDADNKVFGYVCFGNSAQIPTIPPNVYDTRALDIGLGLMPSLCGKSVGLGFLQSCLAFGADSFRLSVACFNKRSIKVYERAGFTTVRNVVRAVSKRDFVIMHLSAQS